MTNLYLNDMNLMRAEAYNSSLNAYFIFEQSDYSLCLLYTSTKPFRPLELVARFKAQLRRYTRYNAHPDSAPESGGCVRVLVLSSYTHVCTLDEKPLTLTPGAYTHLDVYKRQALK